MYLKAMATIVIQSTRETFQFALDAATEANPLGSASGRSTLNAPADGRVTGLVAIAWDSIYEELTNAYDRGREYISVGCSLVMERVKASILEAGDQAALFREILLEKIRVFVKASFERCLSLVPDSVRIGSRDCILSKVSFTQKVTLSGSVELCLTKAFDVAAEGGIELETEYSFAS